MPLLRQSLIALAAFEYIMTRAFGFDVFVSLTNAETFSVASAINSGEGATAPHGPARTYGTGIPKESRSMMESSPTALERLPHCEAKTLCAVVPSSIPVGSDPS